MVKFLFILVLHNNFETHQNLLNLCLMQCPWGPVICRIKGNNGHVSAEQYRMCSWEAFHVWWNHGKDWHVPFAFGWWQNRKLWHDTEKDITLEMAKGVFLICYGPWKIIVICLSVSGLFHLAEYSSSSSMLLQMTQFPFF